MNDLFGDAVGRERHEAHGHWLHKLHQRRHPRRVEVAQREAGQGH